MTNIHRDIVDGKYCVLRFDQADSSANVFNLERLVELERVGGDVVVVSAFLDLVEEVGIDAQLVIDIERIHVEEFLQVHLGAVCAENSRVGIEFADFVLQ